MMGQSGGISAAGLRRCFEDEAGRNGEWWYRSGRPDRARNAQALKQKRARERACGVAGDSVLQQL